MEPRTPEVPPSPSRRRPRAFTAAPSDTAATANDANGGGTSDGRDISSSSNSNSSSARYPDGERREEDDMGGAGGSSSNAHPQNNSVRDGQRKSSGRREEEPETVEVPIMTATEAQGAASPPDGETDASGRRSPKSAKKGKEKHRSRPVIPRAPPRQMFIAPLDLDPYGSAPSAGLSFHNNNNSNNNNNTFAATNGGNEEYADPDRIARRYAEQQQRWARIREEGAPVVRRRSALRRQVASMRRQSRSRSPQPEERDGTQGNNNNNNNDNDNSGGDGGGNIVERQGSARDYSSETGHGGGGNSNGNNNGNSTSAARQRSGTRRRSRRHHRRVRARLARRYVEPVELQVEGLTEVVAKTMFALWFAALIAALVVVVIPGARWRLVNVCGAGEPSQLRHMDRWSSDCAAASPTPGAADGSYTVEWGGGGDGVAGPLRSGLNRYRRIALSVAAPPPGSAFYTEKDGTRGTAVVTASVTLDGVPAGLAGLQETELRLRCKSGDARCAPVRLTEDVLLDRTLPRGGSLRVTLRNVPPEIGAAVAAGPGTSAAGLAYQRRAYTLGLTIVRYIFLLFSLVHAVRFVAVLKYTSTLYEQAWVFVAQVALFWYLDPLYAANIVTHPLPTVLAFIEFRVPNYFFAICIALMYSLITASMSWTVTGGPDYDLRHHRLRTGGKKQRKLEGKDSSAAGVSAAQERGLLATFFLYNRSLYDPPRWTKMLAVLYVIAVFAVDMADAARHPQRWFSQSNSSGVFDVTHWVVLALIAAGAALCLVLVLYLRRFLGAKPYLETRPQQLASRVFVIIFITALLYFIIHCLVFYLYVNRGHPALLSRQPFEDIPSILVGTLFVNILTIVYATRSHASEGVPVSAGDPRWKFMVWPDSWHRWLVRHGGSQYIFLTEAEETRFYHIQFEFRKRQYLARLKREERAARERGGSRGGRRGRHQGTGGGGGEDAMSFADTLSLLNYSDMPSAVPSRQPSLYHGSDERVPGGGAAPPMPQWAAQMRQRPSVPHSPDTEGEDGPDRPSLHHSGNYNYNNNNNNAANARNANNRAAEATMMRLLDQSGMGAMDRYSTMFLPTPAVESPNNAREGNLNAARRRLPPRGSGSNGAAAGGGQDLNRRTERSGTNDDGDDGMLSRSVSGQYTIEGAAKRQSRLERYQQEKTSRRRQQRAAGGGGGDSADPNNISSNLSSPTNRRKDNSRQRLPQRRLSQAAPEVSPEDVQLPAVYKDPGNGGGDDDAPRNGDHYYNNSGPSSPLGSSQAANSPLLLAARAGRNFSSPPDSANNRQQQPPSRQSPTTSPLLRDAQELSFSGTRPVATGFFRPFAASYATNSANNRNGHNDHLDRTASITLDSRMVGGGGGMASSEVRRRRSAGGFGGGNTDTASDDSASDDTSSDHSALLSRTIGQARRGFGAVVGVLERALIQAPARQIGRLEHRTFEAVYRPFQTSHFLPFFNLETAMDCYNLSWEVYNVPTEIEHAYIVETARQIAVKESGGGCCGCCGGSKDDDVADETDDNKKKSGGDPAEGVGKEKTKKKYDLLRVKTHVYVDEIRTPEHLAVLAPRKEDVAAAATAAAAAATTTASSSPATASPTAPHAPPSGSAATSADTAAPNPIRREPSNPLMRSNTDASAALHDAGNQNSSLPNNNTSSTGVPDTGSPTSAAPPPVATATEAEEPEEAAAARTAAEEAAAAARDPDNPSVLPINLDKYGYKLLFAAEARGVQVLIATIDLDAREHAGKAPRIVVAFRGTCNIENAKDDAAMRRTRWSELARAADDFSDFDVYDERLEVEAMRAAIQAEMRAQQGNAGGAAAGASDNTATRKEETKKKEKAGGAAETPQEAPPIFQAEELGGQRWDLYDFSDDDPAADEDMLIELASVGAKTAAAAVAADRRKRASRAGGASSRRASSVATTVGTRSRSSMFSGGDDSDEESGCGGGGCCSFCCGGGGNGAAAKGNSNRSKKKKKKGKSKKRRWREPTVHSGFLSVWRALKPTVCMAMLLLLRAHRDTVYRVFTTGHSLGGALASLAAFSLTRLLRYMDYPIPEVTCYTYGEPRIGNSACKDIYNRTVPRTFRVQNESDMVVTFGMLKGHHVGISVTIDRNGNYIVKPSPVERMFPPTKGRGLTIMNHLMTNYGGSMNAVVRRSGGMCPARALQPYVTAAWEKVERELAAEAALNGAGGGGGNAKGQRAAAAPMFDYPSEEPAARAGPAAAAAVAVAERADATAAVHPTRLAPTPPPPTATTEEAETATETPTPSPAAVAAEDEKAEERSAKDATTAASDNAVASKPQL